MPQIAVVMNNEVIADEMFVDMGLNMCVYDEVITVRVYVDEVLAEEVYDEVTAVGMYDNEAPVVEVHDKVLKVRVCDDIMMCVMRHSLWEGIVNAGLFSALLQSPYDGLRACLN